MQAVRVLAHRRVVQWQVGHRLPVVAKRLSMKGCSKHTLNFRHHAVPTFQSTPKISTTSSLINNCNHGMCNPMISTLGMLHPYLLGTTHFAAIRVYSSSQRPPNPQGRIASSLGMIGAGGMLLLGKGKYILGALKLTKFASLGSMLLTVGAYSAFFGVPYAVGMTSLILIHESGHALTMKKLGIPFSPMVFIPFMGAAVAMRKRPKDAYEEALVAFGGPGKSAFALFYIVTCLIVFASHMH